MKLYYFPLSPYSQKVLIALNEKGVEVELVPVDIMDTEQHDNFKSIYPLGILPLLAGSGSFIPESTIIVEYLEDTYLDKGTTLIPTSRQDARRVRFKTSMVDNHLTPSARVIYFEGIKPPSDQDQSLMQKKRDTIEIMYSYMNKAAQNNTWIHGDHFTMADCTLIPALRLANYLHPISQEHRDLLTYLNMGLERESVSSVFAKIQ